MIPLLSAILASVAVTVLSGSDLPRPSRSQAEWQNAEIGVFVHWAPNVYQGSEGDNLSTPNEKIDPDRFNAVSIVRAAKAAHAGYLIFVAKHIGGYCAWQTATTDYSIKSSPWKNGKGDMVGELATACRKQGLRFGVYLSPRSDIHKVDTGGHATSVVKQDQYNAIYRQQLTEILTHYGPMFEMWFDGGNIVPVNDLIAKLSPDIITFQGRRANSTRWVGNEQGFAPYPCWNTIPWKEGETAQEGAGSPTGNLWCPAECDVSILRPNWFWSEGSDRNILGLDQLIEIYYMSVGRGVNLLLNITPDNHGEIPDAQIKRLKEFGDEIDARFGKPLYSAHGRGKVTTLTFDQAEPIDHISLREDIRDGEHIRKFIVEGKMTDGNWVNLVTGSQIGNRQIFPVNPIVTSQLRLTVLECIGEVKIREFAAYHVNRLAPKAAYRDSKQ